jgi:hypothetical protein
LSLEPLLNLPFSATIALNHHKFREQKPKAGRKLRLFLTKPSRMAKVQALVNLCVFFLEDYRGARLSAPPHACPPGVGIPPFVQELSASQRLVE